MASPKIKATRWADYYALRPSYHDDRWSAQVGIHARREPTPEAQFMEECIKRWGMVAGQPNGEDSAGRSRLDLMTPSDVVRRAAETTELAFAEFERRGWIVDLPPMDEVIDAMKAAEDSND